MTRLLAIVAAYKEEEQAVANTVAQIKAHAPDLDVLAVDDGSTDCTAAEATGAAAALLRMPFNVGIGGAMLRADPDCNTVSTREPGR